MAKVINCECGFVVRGAEHDELIRKAEQHIQTDHPELVGQMSREQLLGMSTEE
jgi:predicted small metal-binding protein